MSRAMLVAAGAAMTLSGCDAPWISVAHADPVDDAISLAPQYGAPPEWLERRRRGDAGVSADVTTTPDNGSR
jgi:hypothetical protein